MTEPCASCAQDETSLTSDPTAGTKNSPSENAITFSPPAVPKPSIIIEFCDRCRWLHRATWTQTELLLTFPTPALRSITLMPLNSPETGGRFRIWLHSEKDMVLLWDRKLEGAFPEMKVLKQRVRDLIDPKRSLGHSDKPTAE